MENVKAANQETMDNDTSEKVTKPHQSPGEQQDKDNQLQQQLLQKQVEEAKQIETPGKKLLLLQGPQIINEYDDDEDEDDDDEEKETSQKLVIDIPDDDEEEEKDEEDDDVIALDDLPEVVSLQKENEIVSAKPQEVSAIITLSDGEEDNATNEAVTKPGKIQKRRSMGASSANDEEHYRLKRRKINAAGAPKLPLTGYVRYMNDRRDSLRKENPSKTHMEHTKMIGEEWHALPSEVKSSYLKAADVDKQRYVKELHSFLKSRPDILASELAKNKVRKTGDNNSPVNPSAVAPITSTIAKSLPNNKTQINEISKNATKDSWTKNKVIKEMGRPTPSTSQQAITTDNNRTTNNEKNKCKRTPTPPNNAITNVSSSSATAGMANSTTTTTTTTSSSLVTPTPGEIPIFTNEFLEHNKIYDMELRALRKSKTDLELQNSVLEKHVENMKFGVEKMITENNELEEKNRLLEIYLDKLKRKLALAFNALPLPSAPHGATVDNIDKYMQDLYKMSTSNSTGPATLNKAKDIIRKLDLQIQL